MVRTREKPVYLFGDLVTVRDRTKTESQGKASLDPYEKHQRAKKY